MSTTIARRVVPGVLAALLLTACSPVPPGLVPPTLPVAETPSAAGVVAVTPRDSTRLSADELAQILQIARWKFDVEMPVGEMTHYQLEFHKPGEGPLLLSSFAMQASGQSEDELLVAVYPIDGSMLGARELRVFIGVGGSSTSAVIENPAAAYTFVSPLTPARTLEVEGEGQRFTLMEFAATGRPIPSPENARLVLAVQR